MISLPQRLCPHSEPQPPAPAPPPQEVLQDRQVGLAQAPVKSLFSVSPGARETLCAPSESGVFISHSPMEFL